MRRGVWVLGALGVTGAILVGCLAPAGRLPHLPGSPFDKVQHLLAFALFGLAWHRAGLSLRWVLLLGILVAAGTETGQLLLDQGRAAEWLDAVADVAGALLGGALSALAPPRRVPAPVAVGTRSPRSP